MTLDIEQRYTQIRSCWPPLAQGHWMKMEYCENLVSVIITTYQRADYIIQTANSIFGQTYRPIELLIIDDGSKDDTNSKIDNWIKNLPKDDTFEVKYFYQANSGAPTARNLALSLSKGEFIQEVGSDDLIHPEKIALHVRCLHENANCQSAWSPLRRFVNSEENKLFQPISQTELKTLVRCKERSPFLFEPQFLPSAALHRRSVFFYAGPWMESLKRWQDLEYQIRMAWCIGYYAELNIELYFFRQHDGTRINSQYRQLAGLQSGFLALESIENTLGQLKYKNERVNLEISKFYFSLAELAASHNEKKELSKAINGALRNRKDFVFHLRMRVYKFLNYLFGWKFVDKISKIYLKHKNN